jgi:hypothetical protein
MDGEYSPAIGSAAAAAAAAAAPDRCRVDGDDATCSPHSRRSRDEMRIADVHLDCGVDGDDDGSRGSA